MSENKTAPTALPVETFLASVTPDVRRQEAMILDGLFRKVTGYEPVLWGPSIIGYGRYHYRYDSGREGTSLATGFSPRKDAVSVYIMPGYADFADILKDLGPHKLGKSCLYLKHLARIDLAVLERVIRAGLDDLRNRWPVLPR